jgi:hypothetical protein
MDLTHYKKQLEQEYLGGWDLLDSSGKPTERTVTISKIEYVPIFDPRKKKESKKLVIHFQEPVKKMIVTNRNQRILRNMLESKFAEQWIGKKITLTTREEVHFEEKMDVLKIVQNTSHTSQETEIIALLGKSKKYLSEKEIRTVKRIALNKEVANYRAAIELMKSKLNLKH